MSFTQAAFYLTTVLVYGGVDALACLALNMQFGVAGISNFGFIIFQAAGAYAAAILSMPAAATSNGGFQHYILGWHLPFPLPWIGATIIGGLLALPFVFLVGKRLRGDFAAVGLLVSAVLLNVLVKNYVPLLNGDAGISIVPAPLQSHFDVQSASYQFTYGGVAIVLAILVYFLFRRITESPFGRSLRAMRDNDVVADSLGKNLKTQRAWILVLGGAVAGLSGAILVGFITLWAPGAWGYAETIVLFAAIIIGGAGNHKGAVLGALLVPLGFEEITRFFPQIGSPSLMPALEWVAIGLLIIGFLWFRPDGILPERRRLLSLRKKVTQEELDTDSKISQQSILHGNEDFTFLVRRSEVKPARTESNIILSTSGLTKTYSGVTVVSDVNINVQRGHLTGMIGPNGAGKSTTLAMLAGTLPPSAGKIFYDGNDISKVPSHERAQMGLVRTFQLASEFKKLTVLENLVCAIPRQSGDSFIGSLKGRRYWGAEDKANIEHAEEVLNDFGLGQYADTYAGQLSGGQRRLVEIMRALLIEPQVLLLDEPMAGVHPNLARKIGRHLVKLTESGMTILMVEHNLPLMDEFCDPVIVLAEGKVLAEGTMSDLRAKSEVVEAYLVG
jgi:branched-chain amino acid transport system permease protein